jgi:F-type H+-transporting ATPase subunit c
VNRLSTLVLVSALLLGLALPALAQETGKGGSAAREPGEAASAAEKTGAAASAGQSQRSLILGAVGLGCALIIAAASYGIAKIGTAAVDSMARQPEVAGDIRMAMLIAGAFIEGVTFFALIVCFLALLFER